MFAAILFFFVKPALDCEEFDLFDPLFKRVIFLIGNFRPYEKMCLDEKGKDC